MRFVRVEDDVVDVVVVSSLFYARCRLKADPRKQMAPGVKHTLSSQPRPRNKLSGFRRFITGERVAIAELAEGRNRRRTAPYEHPAICMHSSHN